MEEYYSIVERPSGFFIVSFESVEEDLEPTAKVSGSFATEESASEFIRKFSSEGFGGDCLLFFKGDDDG